MESKNIALLESKALPLTAGSTRRVVDLESAKMIVTKMELSDALGAQKKPNTLLKHSTRLVGIIAFQPLLLFALIRTWWSSVKDFYTYGGEFHAFTSKYNPLIAGDLLHKFMEYELNKSNNFKNKRNENHRKQNITGNGVPKQSAKYPSRKSK